MKACPSAVDGLAEREVLLDHHAVDQRAQLVGRQALAALDHGEHVAGAHGVARAPAHVAHDAREARHDVREAVSVRTHLAEQLEAGVDRPRPGDRDGDAVAHALLGREREYATLAVRGLLGAPVFLVRVRLGVGSVRAAAGERAQQEEEQAGCGGSCPSAHRGDSGVTASSGRPIRPSSSARVVW